MIDVKFLTTEDAIRLHDYAIKNYGGLSGIRDKTLLESALAQAELTAHFQEIGIYQIAALYCFGIIKNHPFVDGNKRTGMFATFYFLELHDIEIKASEEVLYDFALDVAQSKYTVQEIAEFFEKHSSYIH